MIKRIVEISHASWISLKDHQLVVEQDRNVVSRIPIEDLGLLLLAHPGNTITQQALSACQQADVAVVLCDEKYLPIALMIPLSGSSLHTATLQMQINVKSQVAKSLWRDIVAAKIMAQASHLTFQGKRGQHLEAMTRLVGRDDAAQREAQAAAYYWRELLGTDFRRDQNGDDINTLLNYGYAVLRASVARAIVGAGLHPALGVFHHNRGDSFALADDLMEPLRPAVDQLANRQWSKGQVGLLPVNKRAMLELLSCSVILGGQPLPLWVALQRYASSVKAVMSGEGKKVEIPIWQFSGDTGLCG